MEMKLTALVFIALVIASGAGYGLGYMLTANATGKVNVTNFPTSWAQSSPSAYTSISLGQKFNWSIGEVVAIQQNKYVYLGHDVSSVYWQHVNRPSVGTIHLAKWLNGWVELYYEHGYPQSVSLSPYTLQIYYYSNDYLTGELLEG